MLHSVFYENAATLKIGSLSGFYAPGGGLAPEGFEDSSSASVEKAVQRILRLLYAGMERSPEAVSDYTPPKKDRNAEIYQRYLTGERAVDLAREYGMSLQRIYVIIRNQKK